MLDNNNNIMIIFIELQVHNIFCPGGQMLNPAPSNGRSWGSVKHIIFKPKTKTENIIYVVPYENCFEKIEKS